MSMTRIKTDKSIIFIDIVNRKDISGSKIGKDIEKAAKNNLKFRLKCRDLKFKSSETKAELFTLMNWRNRKENRANNLLNVHNSIKIMYNLI